MTTTNIKKDKNWSMIGCAVLAVTVIGYSLATTRISKITEQFRNEQIVQYMNENDTLTKKECDQPIAAYVSAMKSKGVNFDGRNEIDAVDTATRDRCLVAQTAISENRDKMKKVIYTKPTFAYITEKFFN